MDDDDIREFFAPLAPISIRRMFSGKAIYSQGVIFAFVYADELRLKADSISIPEFEAAGSTQWAYQSHRGEVMMPYWSTPHEAFDDPDVMDCWVRLAFAAALRAQIAKPRKKHRAKAARSRKAGVA